VLKPSRLWNPVVATEAGFLAVFGVLFFFNAMHYWPQVIDDAYIAFRFAENLTLGNGLRYNPGGQLVEGFTSPAWVVLSAIAIRFGFDPLVVAKLAGLTCGLAIVVLSWAITKTLRQRTDAWNLLPPLLIATNAHVAFWSMQGMEPLLQVAVLMAAYRWTWIWMREGHHAIRSACAIVFAIFVRIDSIVLLAPLAGCVLIMLALKAWSLRSAANTPEDEAPNPRERIQHVLQWIAAICGALIAFQVMRFLIFGDSLPNTYYAKVAFSPWNGERAHAYLFQFFLNQGGWQQDGGTFHIAWILSGGPINSLAWMNLWLATALLLVTGIIAHPHAKWVEPAALLLGAAVTGAWYTWHVGGDWMPGFRFLMPTFVFICCAMPIALDAWKRLADKWPRVTIAGNALFLLACAGTIAEQARTETAYVFGRDPIWQKREVQWLSLNHVRENINRGFTPALLEAASILALETQPGSRILMSDIGLPMWAAPHLNVIDADGLVDKYLADAPSVRGETFEGPPIPSREQIESELRGQLGNREIDAEVRQWLRHESERLYREEVTQRNVRMIMENIRPEYILVFEVHPGSGTAEPGIRYPEIIERVTRHPGFEDYEWRQSWPKTGDNVWNHLYRRKDVPLELTRQERDRRLEQLIQRNPRVLIFRVMDELGRIIPTEE
jgi:hypothetical protein